MDRQEGNICKTPMSVFLLPIKVNTEQSPTAVKQNKIQMQLMLSSWHKLANVKAEMSSLIRYYSCENCLSLMAFAAPAFCNAG